MQNYLLCFSLLIGLCACRAPLPEGWVLASPRSGNWEIYQLQSETQEWLNLTRYPATERYPDLSPDGQQIVFASDRQGSFDLYLMNRQGESLRELTRSPFPDTTPRWSPDGQWIVFVSEREDRAENLYLIDPVSRQLERLSQAEDTHYDPSWFPDSQELVFIAWHEGQSDLYRQNIKASEPQRLTQDGRPKRQPEVSPDGRWIVYAVQAAAEQWQLEQLELKTGQTQILSEPFTWLGFPRWRSRNQLNFSAYEQGDVGLWQLDLPQKQAQLLELQVREARYWP